MKKGSNIKSEGDFYSRKVGNLFLNHQYNHSWPLLASVASIYIKPQFLSEWPPKNSNPHSPISGPHFLFGPNMDPAQYIEAFWAKKVGSGGSQGAQWAVLARDWKWLFFRLKFFFQFLGCKLPGEFFFIKTIVGPRPKLDSEPKIFLRLTHFGGNMAKKGQKVGFTL